jgi:isocitrate dehydrogenase
MSQKTPITVAHGDGITKPPGMDVVVVRENEEDLYAGIEYQLSSDVMECLKLITRPGTEKIVRFAFEYAKQNGRKKVTCFTKDNIMKMTDGLAGYDIVKTETLRTFDGQQGFTLAQGQ